MASVAPLVVITGPTASGKSGLALELAECYRGEIICADSRTVYRSMDVGTAKPTAEDRARVPHHLLDVVEPGERFTAGEFQRLANQAIADTRSRGNVPFLVGGTGLYIDSVVLNYEFDSRPVDPTVREYLQRMTVDELHMLLKKQQIDLPVNGRNKRHLIRAFERSSTSGNRRSKPDNDTYVVSITTPKEILHERIRTRAVEMFTQGVMPEAQRLGEIYGWNSEAMTGNIYPILRQVLAGELTDAQAQELFITRDKQLVKRQLTWIKRHEYVKQLSIDEARKYLSGLLDHWKVC